MAPSIVDKLPLFDNVATGLMGRVHKLDKTLKVQKGGSTVVDGVDEKVLKNLSKYFPSDPPSMDKMSGLQLVQREAKAICAFLHEFYTTFVDLAQFQAMTHELLQNVIADMKDLQFAMHPELVSSILSLFTSYIKVPLVWTRVQFDIKGLLGLYGYCYRVTNGTNDNDYELVSSYTVKFGDFPLQIIQNELQTINLQPLVQLLLTTKDIYESGGDPVTLQKQGAFDFEASMDGQFVMKKTYQNLLFHERIREWVIYFCLSRPDQLENQTLLDFLKVVTADSYMVPVFQGQLLNYHDVFGDIFTGKNYTPPECAAKLKKTITDMGKFAVIEGGRYHRQRRFFAKWVLKSLRLMYEHDPQLIAPTFPMVFAALAMAREEVMWYFYHHDQLIPQRVKPKHFVEIIYDHGNIPDLIVAAEKIRGQIVAHDTIITTYYSKLIQETYAEVLTTVIDSFLIDPTMDPRVQNILKAIPNQLRTLTHQDEFRTIRRSWTRSVIYFVCSDIPIEPTMNELMNQVLLHGQVVGSLSTLLETQQNFSNIWWFQDSYLHLLKTTVQGEQLHLYMPLLGIAKCFPAAFHNFCPEDDDIYHSEIGCIVEQSIGLFGDAVASTIDAFRVELAKLDEQITPIQAAHRLQRQQEERTQALRARTFTPKAPEKNPGFESRPWAAKSIHGLTSNYRKLALLCKESLEVTSLIIYDNQICITSLLQNRIKRAFKECFEQRAEVNALQPSSMLGHISSYLQTLIRLVPHGYELGLDQIIPEVLLKDSETPSYSLTDTSFVSRFCTKLTDTIMNLPPLAESNRLVVSSFAGGLVLCQTERKHSVFYDVQELRSAYTMMGPSGFRVVESELLSLVLQYATSLKQELEANKNALLDVSESIQLNNGLTIDLLKRMKPQVLDNLAHLSISIGNTLIVRKWSSNALRQVTQTTIPIVEAVADMSEKMMIQLNRREDNVNALARDCGIDMPDDDESLRRTLAPLKETLDDMSIWDLLPHALAASFYSSIWKDTEFLPLVDGFKNNGHCLTESLNALFTIFRPMVDLETRDDELSSDTEASMRSFILAASTVMLEMQRKKKPPSPAMFLFMEKLVTSTAYADYGFMEPCFPHALVHAGIKRTMHPTK